MDQDIPMDNTIHTDLDESQKLSLKHYISWQNSNGTVKAYITVGK